MKRRQRETLRQGTHPRNSNVKAQVNPDSRSRGLCVRGHGVQELNDPTLSNVITYVNKLRLQKHSWIELKDENGSYVRCLGNCKSVVIDVHTKTGTLFFKHFVLRRQKRMSKKLVPIGLPDDDTRVRENEKLSLKEAKEVFECFWRSKRIPKGFYKRDVTELMKLRMMYNDFMTVYYSLVRKLY